MSQENQSCLRFSLEESVWFRKGQEVEELMSISLDPDITIQEDEQYVNIRGALDLTGEYTCRQDEVVEEGNSAPHRYIQSVEQQEEELYEFSHRFPVDITIPKNRIKSIYDIDVLVDSFDYEFPERSCLRLTADLMILGLYAAETGQSQIEQHQEHADWQPIEEDRTPIETIQLEQLEEEEEELEEEMPIELDPLYRAPLEPLKEFQPGFPQQFNEDEVFVAEARKLPEEEPVPIPAFPFNPLNRIPYFDQLDQQYPDDRKETAPVSETPEASPEPVVEAKEPETVPQQAEEEQTPVQLEESSSSPVLKKKKASKKKSMSLTEFFARKEEDSQHTKLKMCIVQKGDTLDSVADRYHVSLPNILRVNNMEVNQDIRAGQVLYIPVTFAKK